MSWTIIVASGDGDQLDELVNGAQEISDLINASGGGTSIVTASSVDDVRKRRTAAGSRRQLLIVSATLPYRQSSPDRNAEPGLELIKSLGRETEPPACILVSERSEHYRAIQGLKYCEWLIVGSSTNYVEQCRILAGDLGVVQIDPTSDASPRIADNSEGCPAQVPIVAAPSISDGTPSDASPVVGRDEAEENAEQSGSADKPLALLEVELLEGRRAIARLDIAKGRRLVPGETWTLDFKPSQLDELVAESRAIRDRLSTALTNTESWKEYYPKWSGEYRTIGERFARLLWDTRFARLYFEGRGISRGNMRLRFTLEGSSLDGLWEAMLDAGRDLPLMIQNTITRRARPADERRDSPSVETGESEKECGKIGIDDGMLNILVVKSAVPNNSNPQNSGDLFWEDFWSRKGRPLRQLLNIDEEVKVLRGFERPRRAGRGVGGPQVNVDVLERTDGVGSSWSLADEMERRLRERRYDIVHFAGHAEFATNAEGEDGQGYLIFSGQDEPYAVTIDTVASWLQDAEVQLLYLSCCRSSSASAEVEFARNNVPMTIGFNWDLEDSKAVEFADHFYSALLAKANELKVCLAMCEARRKLYKNYKRDMIWASPVLIAQPRDWMKVEGVIRPTVDDRRTRPRRRRAPAQTGLATGGATAMPTPATLHG
jgi:CHAT domain